jgi:hypothetical protein
MREALGSIPAPKKKKKERKKRQKIILLKGGGGPPSVSASSGQEAADPTYKGKLSFLFLSLGAHLDTKCLNYCPA